MARKRANPKLPKIVPGDWTVELLGGGSLHLGGAVNQKPEPHAIEFSFMTLPAFATGPSKVSLPTVVVLMCPAEPIVNEHPGLLMQNGIMTMIDLSATRALFSDLLPRLEAGNVKQITLKAEYGDEGRLPVSSWSITSGFAEKYP